MSEEREDPDSNPSDEHPRAGLREEGLFTVLRSFWRLWGLLLFLLGLLLWFRSIVLPFVFATLVAYMLEPIVRAMAPRLGERRGLSVVLLYLLLFTLSLGFLGGVLPGVVSDLSTLRESTPSAVERLNEELLPKLGSWFEETFPGVLGTEDDDAEQVSEILVQPQPDGSFRVDLREVHLEVHESGGAYVIETQAQQRQSVAEILREIVASKGAELTQLATDAIQSLVSGIASFITDLIITFIIAGILLVDLERFKRFVRSLVPSEKLGSFEGVVRGIDEGMAGVIRGQLLICVINGVLAYVGLVMFGVRYSLLLAMVAAVSSIIPVFGILISAIPLLGVALVSGDAGIDGLEFGNSAGLLLWITVIHLFEANYLNPRVIGTADIHPVILIFALLAGWEVYGPIGAVLALPVASVVQTVFLYARKRSARGGGRERDSSGSSAAIRLDTARHRILTRSDLEDSDVDVPKARGPADSRSGPSAS